MIKMKQDNYFKKFRKLKYQKDADLQVDEPPKKVLWVDEDMLEGMTLGESMRKTMGVMGSIPNDVEIEYCGQDDAEAEFNRDIYSMVIIDNDRYQGRVFGESTLQRIRDADEKVPIIYTADAPHEMAAFVRNNVQEVIATHKMAMNINRLIRKYVLEEDENET
jgi:hypothetical protein